ncbi:MAG: hypothetical protein II458_08885 [Oscillospiraceae bacterium]|nr:hypothetical protein [Oscillospiraceae bacterium]
MSLFSKILGQAGSDLIKKATDAVEKAAADGVLGALDNIAGTNLKEQAKENDKAEPKLQTGSHIDPIPEDGPSGFSWGPTMPDEENQFNFNGTHIEYFEMVFREDFPGYTVRRESSPNGKRTAFTFLDGGRVALVVEVLAQSCDVYKRRRDCAAQGIPYLRFYYDHEGWWNTRAYVDKRVGDALKG